MALRVEPVPPPRIGALNALPPGRFAAAIGPLFEGAPRFLARLAAARPFNSYEDLFARAETVALAMPEEEQIELIDAHPRLGAAPESVSRLSFREQGYDRHADQGPGGPPPEQAELDRLNAAYEARFGFRFCLFVAGRPRAAILPIVEAAVNGDRDAEIRRALTDVVAIAADRYARLTRRQSMGR